jgi:hypothetical protein
MTYKIKYDDDSDVLTIVVKEKGKLSHAQEVGDMILHVTKTVSHFSWRFLKPARSFRSWLKA